MTQSSPQLAPLGARLIAAHDDCRAILRSGPYVFRDRLAIELDGIARQYNLTRDQVSEIMARAMDAYHPCYDYDEHADYTKARA